MSLIELVIALFIFGGLLLIGMQMTGVAFRGRAHIASRADRDGVKRLLLDAVSCSKTMPTGTCTPGSLVTLRNNYPDPTKAIVVKSTGVATRVGNWGVRAVCNADGTGVNIEAVRLVANGTVTTTVPSDFLPDPAQGASSDPQYAAYAWGSAQAKLFPSGVSMCQSYPRSVECTVKSASANPYKMSINSPSSYYASCDDGYQLTGCSTGCLGATTSPRFWFDAANNRCGVRDPTCNNAVDSFSVGIYALCCRAVH